MLILDGDMGLHINLAYREFKPIILKPRCKEGVSLGGMIKKKGARKILEGSILNNSIVAFNINQYKFCFG